MHLNVGTGGYNKTLSIPGASIFIMSSRKSKKHQFRPAMDEASSPMHDEHIKKIREQEKI